MEFLLALGAVVVLALVHLYGGRLGFLAGVPRSRWLSFAGGASVAYVFLHLLPELSERQEHVSNVLGFLDHGAYLIALVGLTVFYGLERAALTSGGRGEGREGSTEAGVFWLHMATFGPYNVIVGYLLLHRETNGTEALLWYALAMALHFLVNDYGLRDHHRERYDRVGRWVLAAAVLGGWGLGATTGGVPPEVVSVLFALLAGGVILNVLKEELPEERDSRFGAFALGSAAYAALLMVG